MLTRIVYPGQDSLCPDARLQPKHFWRFCSGFGASSGDPGGCLGRVLLAILEDAGSKIMFFELSCEMYRHLGAKMEDGARQLERRF